MSLNLLDTKAIDKISLKNTLKSHYSEKAMIELIFSKIKEIPEYSQLKADIELTLIVCRMIETISADSDLKLDKLQTIIQVYSKAFEMSTGDQLALVIQSISCTKIKASSIKKLLQKNGEGFGLVVV
jgi:hypothetical protein